MKLLATLITSATVLACVSVSSAQTKLYIAGSTAYRGQVHNALLHFFGSGTTTTLSGTNTYGYVGTSGIGKANSATFIGSGTDGNQYVVKTSWTGSVAGIFEVAGNHAVAFLPDGITTSGTGTPNQANPQTSGNPNDSKTPDVCMADTFQGSTPFSGNFSGTFYPALVESGSTTNNGPVGVVPFEWVATANAPTLLNNMTPQLAKGIYTGVGALPLALFTGGTTSTDKTTFVYGSGRDNDSGTRLTAFAETGVGVFTTVQQNDPASGTLFPAETVDGIFLDVGQGGYAVGGDLANAMVANASGLIFVTYLSTGDATTVTTGGGKVLNYAGVTFSNQAIIAGQYTFWGYEHMLHLSSLSGAKLTVANRIADQIYNVDAALLIPNMLSTRGTDGDVVTPTY